MNAVALDAATGGTRVTSTEMLLSVRSKADREMKPAYAPAVFDNLTTASPPVSARVAAVSYELDHIGPRTPSLKSSATRVILPHAAGGRPVSGTAVSTGGASIGPPLV